MTEQTYTCTILTAAEGMVLTNADGTFFGRVIYLSANDSPVNYHEITTAEYITIVASQNTENEG